MDGEMRTYIKVWVSALASLTYCYLISLNIPKGRFRLLSLLPVFYFLTILPLKLNTVCLASMTAFFLTWLANFKLLLFSFGQGPLSTNPSISLAHFISIACFPIKVKNKQNPSPQNTKSTSSNLEKPLNTKTKETPSLKIPTKGFKPLLNLAIKVLICLLLTLVYQHKQHIHPKVMLAYYCCFMYLGLELYLGMVATLVGTLVGLETEPHFNEPYLSTSLQDFWGRRWNLMVTGILRPIVYQPVTFISMKLLGTKWASLPAVLMTFVASGLVHEIVYYYITHVSPTWEVTWFFVLQGVLVVVEIVMKKIFKGRWRLHPLVSWAFTIGILVVTGDWLFFPQLLRCDTDVRINRELIAVTDYFKDLGKSIGISSSS